MSWYCFIYVFSLLFFFFFKQKTAYEMRISDWSSDVCSSDLIRDVMFNRSRSLRPGPDEPLSGNHRQDHRRAGGRPRALGPALGHDGGEGIARHSEECRAQPLLPPDPCA